MMPIFNNPVIWMIMGFAVLFVIVPLLFFGVGYLLSFNRKALIIQEVGKNEENCRLRIVKFKTVKHNKLGNIIKFFPMSGLPIAKRFSSNYWSWLKYKGKMIECLVLYAQGENFRPVSVVHNSPASLLVKNEDNREFILDNMISTHRWSDESKLYMITTIGFFIYMFLLASLSILLVVYMMKENANTYVLAKGMFYGS